jgi:hypothetical protein
LISNFSSELCTSDVAEKLIRGGCNLSLSSINWRIKNSRLFKSRRMRWTRDVACMTEMRNAYRILENLKGREFGRPKRRWED